MSSRLARQNIDALLDAAPAGIRNQIIAAVSSVAACSKWTGFESGAPESIFCRPFRGGGTECDFSAVRAMATAVADAVHRVLPDADVVVHSYPASVGHGEYFRPHSGRGDPLQLNVHDVSVQDLLGGCMWNSISNLMRTSPQGSA